MDKRHVEVEGVSSLRLKSHVIMVGGGGLVVHWGLKGDGTGVREEERYQRAWAEGHFKRVVTGTYSFYSNSGAAIEQFNPSDKVEGPNTTPVITTGGVDSFPQV